MTIVDCIPYLNLIIPIVLFVGFLTLYLLTEKINYLTMLPSMAHWFYLYVRYLRDQYLGRYTPGDYQIDFRLLYLVLGLSMIIYVASELYAIWIIRRSYHARMDN